MPKTLVPELTDPESRKALAEAVTAVLRRWGLTPTDQSTLLGLKQPRELEPEEALPEDPALMERVGHLLAIERALRRLYPYQERQRDRWITTPEPRLARKAPLEAMLARGIEGIRTVRELLESRVREEGRLS
jgi:hypothetical protein